MSKKMLGISLAYYKNSDECEVQFKQLMETLNEQLTDDMIICIYEDGQYSGWLQKYAKDNIFIHSNKKNLGVSVAKNYTLDYLQDKVEYILFLDADDYVSNNYLSKVYEYCADMTHDIIETTFYIRGKAIGFDRNIIRSCACGSAIKCDVIGKHRFDEKIQIGEDTKFMNEVCDLTKQRKKYCRDAEYYYLLGVNPNSLTVKYERNELKKERVN